MAESNESYEMLQCPYNAAHIILRYRMANHLVKCRQQHPSERFETCPFNGTHDVPAPELRYHVETCPDRKTVENYIYVVGDPELEEAAKPAQVEIPPTSENWDDEACTAGSYLDAKDKVLEKQMVFRNPVGMSKSSKKQFHKREVQRFGSLSN